MSEKAPTITGVARMSDDQIREAYDPAVWTIARNAYGASLLSDALRHTDGGARQWLSHRLLDDGLDPVASGGPYLHVLLSARPCLPKIDIPLLQRLVAAGMDVNRLEGKFGRPIQTAAQFLRPPEVLDALFAFDGLDLLRVDSAGNSVRSTARRGRHFQPGLYDRVEAYLVEHGIDAPAPHPADAAGWATAEELEVTHRPDRINEPSPETGATLLLGVLHNPAVDIRTTWVPRLLAEGADATVSLVDGRNALHLALVGTGRRDPKRDAEVVQLLVAAGAEVNASADAKIGTPLNVLGRYTNKPERELTPLYDALLSATGLDPRAKVGRSKTAWDHLQKARRTRPVLVERVEQMLGD